MRRILVVGASNLQVPAIKKAKEMGFYVAVADFNPLAEGIQYADEYFNVSTIDEEKICEAAKTFQAEAIVTVATDMPMKAIAYSCEKLQLPSISYGTAVKATDKEKMIQAFEKAGVSHPWYYVVCSKEELEGVKAKIKFPCISKPTDQSGSRGVCLCSTMEELERSVAYSSQLGRKGSVLIEEFLQGQEVSVEILVLEAVVHILQITDKQTTGAPNFVETGHSQPSNLPAMEINSIRALAEQAVKAVGIQNGAAHVEIMSTKSGAKMIELGARMGGDCITTHLVPLSTGIDMLKANIEIACGDKPNIEPTLQKGSAIRFISASSGVIEQICGLDQAQNIEGVVEIVLLKKVGDQIRKVTNSSERLGYVIAQGNDGKDALEICEKALEQIKIIVK